MASRSAPPPRIRQVLNLTSDGAVGAIVTWLDYRSGDYGIYAQRVNASGAIQWSANGVPSACWV